MTKVRDIAAFLGKTEAFNTTNKRLAFDSNQISTLTPTIATDIIRQYGVVVYNTVDSLPASPNDGDRAWVTGNNRFYIADSSWHNALLINTPPTINILNYDSALNDSSSLTMTIQVTDSFENLDIISFGATISPSNITDSAVLTFSRDSSVLALAINPDSANSTATSFSITFSANDQVNLATSIKSFTIDRGVTLEQLSQIKSFSTLGGRQIINVDSDVVGGAFQLTVGDVLVDSNDTIQATITDVSGFSIEFLNALYQNYQTIGTAYGATVGAQSAGTFVIDKSGTFDSSHIGRFVSTSSNVNTWKTQFRNGSTTGGQIITHFTEIAAQVGTSSFSPFTLLGSPPTTNGGLVMYNVTIPAGYYSFNADYSSPGYIASNRLYTSRQGKTLVWTTNIGTGNFSFLGANVTYWNGRYNYMEYTNTSGVTYFRVQNNQTSFFTAGSQIWSTGSSSSGASRPSDRDVVECNHLVVHSSSYNSGTNETTVYCGNQYGRQINQLFGGGFSYITFTTGAVSPAQYIAFWKTVSLTSNITFFEGNSQSVGTSLDVGYGDTVNQSNYYLDMAYGVRKSQGGTQTSTQVNMYTQTTPAYYRVNTTPSPAGDGSQIDLGTSTVNVYSVKKETAISVDSYSGFTAGKFIQKKT